MKWLNITDVKVLIGCLCAQIWIGCASTLISNVAPIQDDFVFLQRLVEINSGTKNVDGVNKVQGLVEYELTKLGFKTEYKYNPIDPNRSGKFLIATLLGAKSDRFITIIMHADTVFEPSSGFTSMTVSEDGKIMRGPGVGDDKGGIVIGLSALRRFLARQQHPQSLSIRVVSVPNEESGSSEFSKLFKEFSKDTVVALGLESTNPDGSIVEGRSGIRKYEIKIVGKEAHSGVSHKEGASACHELVIKLDQIQRLTNYQKGITVNIGDLRGGVGKYNIMCAEAEAKVEVRFTTPEAKEYAINAIDAILKKTNVRSFTGNVPTVTQVTMSGTAEPFAVNKKSKPYVRIYQEILKRTEGVTRNAVHLNGIADINQIITPQMVGIDDLGPVGGGAHTKDEYIELSSLESRSKALAEFLEMLMIDPKMNAE